MSASEEAETDAWGSHAATYDRVYAPLTGYIARSLLAMTDARLPADARVLDIACGSGALLFPAIERARRRRAAGGSDFVVGCDYSAGMLAEAQRNAGRAYDAELFRCEVQDGQAMSYEDASFDAAYSCFGIFLFEDRRAGWREAARVLKRGGLFGTSTWLAPEHNEMFRAQFQPIMEALPDRLKEDPSSSDWTEVADPNGLKLEVEQAGFTSVEVHSFEAKFVLPSVEVAWNALVDNPAGGALIRQCDASERKAVEESFARGMARYARDEDEPILLEASCNLLTARRE